MKYLKKYLRPLIAVILLSMILAFLWTPHILIDKDKGYVSLNWSGLSALFNEKDFGLKRNYYVETSFNGIDGPYIFNTGYELKAYRVTKNNSIDSMVVRHREPMTVHVPNASADSFTVLLRPETLAEKCRYEMPSKLLVISDIEGNFNAFHSFLTGNGVIDKYYNWTFGNGHVVLLGDFVDRGQEVTQVLWLIYMLEDQAKYQGGRVHFILGNHELMNIQGRTSYADRKYVKFAQEISGLTEWNLAYRKLFAYNSVLGAWLRSKNTAEQIGDYLFVHGGFSPAFPDSVSLEKLNKKMRESLDSAKSSDELAKFLQSKEGPLWYRGMAANTKAGKKITVEQFNKLLVQLNTKKIVIGHTVMTDIEKDYDGQLIRIDVQHGKVKRSGQTKGLVIEKGIEYKTDDRGRRTAL